MTICENQNTQNMPALKRQRSQIEEQFNKRFKSSTTQSTKPSQYFVNTNDIDSSLIIEEEEIILDEVILEEEVTPEEDLFVFDQEEEIKQFICPLSKQLITTPVTCGCKCLYERTSIEKIKTPLFACRSKGCLCICTKQSMKTNEEAQQTIQELKDMGLYSIESNNQ
jgi:hypothetical protein